MIKSSLRGELALLKVMLRAAELGYVVSRPVMECVRYDLILDGPGGLKRAQVKYANGRSNHASGAVNVKFVGRPIRPYTVNDIDVMLVYLPATDKVYCLPSKLWVGKHGVVLRVEPPKNNQKSKCLFASAFEW